MTLDSQQLSFTRKHYFSNLYLCPSKYLKTEHDLITLKDQTGYYLFMSLLLYYPIIQASKRLRDHCSVCNFLLLVARICFISACNALIYLDALFILPSVLLFALVILLIVVLAYLCFWIFITIVTVCFTEGSNKTEGQQLVPARELSFDEWITKNNEPCEDPCDPHLWTMITAPPIIFNIATILFICFVIV